MYLALGSLLCWFLSPIALVFGFIVQKEARRATGSPNANAHAAIIVGGMGSVLLVGALVVGIVSKRSAPKLVESPEISVDRAPASASAVQTDAERREEQARTDDALKAARQLFADRAQINTSFQTIDDDLSKRQLSGARKTLDELFERFVGIDPAYLVPADNADPAARDALAATSGMLTRFRQAKTNVESNEFAVFNAAFDLLENSQNSHVNQAQIFSSVGSRFGLSGKEVESIYDRNSAEVARREAAKADAQAQALLAQCGPKPKVFELNGSLMGAKEFVQRTANDPDSIEVTNCSDPAVKAGSCWSVVCDVRGKNAFNAKVLRQMVFTVRGGDVVGARPL
ncbi:MAG TPA: DUF4190 domain-containing protein [Polyangiaceae bacterium]|nr:DUF4190 domain-containing protein [Polyangiaceae bacterium]